MLRSLPLLAALGGALFLSTGCDDEEDDGGADASALALVLLGEDGSGSVPTDLAGTLDREGYESLYQALVATGLDATVGGSGTFTVFAPSDEAFANPPAPFTDVSDTLLYHVVSGTSIDSATAVQAAGSDLTMANGGSVLVDLIGNTLYLNDARVTRTDVVATNGLIHELDKVLLPPTDLVNTLTARGYSTLVELVVRADGRSPGLLAALQAGNLTLFAPSNDAFAAAGITDVSALTEAQVDDLVPVLLYHVVPLASVRASTAVAAGPVDTLLGSGRQVAVTVGDGGPQVIGETNAPAISVINIPCTGGVVIHGITSVLLPQTSPAPTNG